MKLWWLRVPVVAWFLTGLILTDVAVAGYRDVWRMFSPDDYADRIESCRLRRQDAILLGGSVVSEGIDPRLLRGVPWRGTRMDAVFNMGLPGGTASEAWHAVRLGVKQPPALLIIGMTASDLNENRQAPQGPETLMTAVDVAHWAWTRPDSAEWVVRHFIQGRASRSWSLYRYRNGIRLWAADLTERCRPGSFPEAAAEAHANRNRAEALQRGDGFAPRESFLRGRFDQAKEVRPEYGPLGFLDRYRINGGHLANVHRLLDWARRSNVDVVLLDMPVTEDLEERLRPREFATFRDVVRGVAQQRGIPLIRAERGAVGLTDAEFADLFHLNAEGGRRLALWLRQTLERGL